MPAPHFPPFMCSVQLEHTPIFNVPPYAGNSAESSHKGSPSTHIIPSPVQPRTSTAAFVWGQEFYGRGEMEDTTGLAFFCIAKPGQDQDLFAFKALCYSYSCVCTYPFCLSIMNVWSIRELGCVPGTAFHRYTHSPQFPSFCKNNEWKWPLVSIKIYIFYWR